MNLIEEAAKRLWQLEQAGIDIASHAGGLDRVNGRREPFLRKETAPVEGQSCTIDLQRLQAAGFIAPSVTDSKLLHEFRVIKRPLIQSALQKSGPPANGNLIMVTSALPGEGKTFVAVNLAMSIAMEVDCTVMLVDADVVSPSIPAVLDIPPAKGLMDVLTQPHTGLGDAIQRTNVERLALVQAGTSHQGASELLASDAMSRLLSEVSHRYPDRIVLFDSPPLLATTESRVLANRMGQVLVVVEAGRTTHSDLESALAMLESGPVVLTMLNKAPESAVGSYYGRSGYGR